MIFFSTNYSTPLHLAAGNAHLEVVKLFYDFGSLTDDWPWDIYSIKEVQDCRQPIKGIEKEKKDLKIIKELREEIEETKDEIKEANKEDIEETNDGIKETNVANDKIGVIFIPILLFTVSSFFRNIPGLLWFLTAFLMFSQVGDRSMMVDYGIRYVLKLTPN